MTLIRAYLVIKDKRRRRMAAGLEERKRRLKAKIAYFSRKPKRQMKLLNSLHRLPRDSSSTRTRNFCILTGKARSVYQDFHLSRHQIRRLGLMGDLVGIRKSSF